MILSKRALFYSALLVAVLLIQKYLNSDSVHKHIKSYKESKAISSKQKELVEDSVKKSQAALQKSSEKSENETEGKGLGEENELSDFDPKEKIFTKEESQAFFQNDYPEKAILRDLGVSTEIRGSILTGVGSGEGKILNILTTEFIREVQSRRGSTNNVETEDVTESDISSLDEKSNSCSLEYPDVVNNYRVIRFQPGLNFDQKTQISAPRNIDFAISGPDYSFKPISKSDSDYDCEIKKIRSRVLSFGHGGFLILELNQGKGVYDGPGDDFAIFENPFPYGAKFFNEFAFIGVTDSLDKDFQYFPCSPDSSGQTAVDGCAGVIPLKLGGDGFDLQTVGLTQAKYLIIKDTNLNYDIPKPFRRDSDVAGFDLDAIKLFNY